MTKPLLDEARLDELQEIMAEDFGLLVETFLSDSHALLERLQALTAPGQEPELSKAAHSLKGASLNLGAEGLADLCLTLEGQARAGGVADPQGQLRAIEAALAAVCAQLQARRDAA